MKRISALAFVAGLLAISSPAQSQQQVTLRYQPRLAQPAYSSNGPLVAIDEGHANFHTLAGRYAPFGALALADGYRAAGHPGPLTAASLTGVGVLVIANALPAGPSEPAFTAAEIAAVKTWVAQGGSLLLIADHSPFGAAAAPLAAAFGVTMGQHYVVASQGGRGTANIRYTGHELGDHPIITGRTPKERVRAVTAFTGQSLVGPADASALLVIPAGALEVADGAAIARLNRGEGVPSQAAGGRAQLLALPFGQGRVVVAGEAAMFTAQRVDRGGGDATDVGLMVDDDRQLALNVLHWLTRLIG